MDEFAALSSDREAVDAKTAEWNNNATDNEREGLSLNHASAGTD